MVSYVDYKDTPLRYTGQIRIYDEEAFATMRSLGNIVALCLDGLVDFITPGVTIKAIDDFVFAFAIKNGVLPSLLNYRGFPNSSCTSLNHVVCNGVPSERVLNNGDIINISVMLNKNGWNCATSRMYPIGNVKRGAARLCEVTHEALLRGLAAIKPGNRIGAIGHAIQTFVETERCSVVREFCGHGIGQICHDAPNILHYGELSDGAELKEGMIFALQPMINLGKPDVKLLSDGWTAVTRDRSLSAQYEHTIGVTKEGCEIFTLSPNNSFYIPM